MNYFTIKHRIRKLEEFRELYIEWVKTVQFTGFGFEYNQGNPELRYKINMLIPEVAEAVHSIGFGRVTSFPAPAVGGPVYSLSLINECLHLDQLASRNISRQIIIDSVDKAISVYRKKIKVAFLNLFNPFYWIKCILTFIVRIPFILLEIAGFTDFSRKAEASFGGKLIKLATLILMIIGLVADLRTLGYLKRMLIFLKNLVKY